jgi:hypothetical protein
MKHVQLSVGKLLEKLDSYTGYSVFGRPLPITVSTARTPEQLVLDVQKAEQEKKNKKSLKLDFAFVQKLKNLKLSDFKITEQTIPNYILLLLVVGEFLQICAAITGFAWFVIPCIFGGAVIYLVKMFQDLKDPYRVY